MSSAPTGARIPAGQRGIPALGLGTFGRRGEDGYRAMLTALDLGYRHIDTAQTYGTEENVGRALWQSQLPREEVFITTKIADFNLAGDRLLPSLQESLKRIGVSQVDLTLIHWPSHRDEIPMAEYMTAIAEAKRSGLTRLIGVSNFTIPLLAEAIALLGPGEIATNQVEVHPYLQNRKLRAFSDRKGIPTTAYMPLAQGRVTTDPVFVRIASLHGCSPAAVSLAWLLEKGMIVIPASGRREHLESNLRALSVSLSRDDIAEIDALDRGERIIDPVKAPKWD